MFASSGVSLTRSTLCDIVKASAELLVPLVEQMRAAVLKSSLMWTDDTIVPTLIKGGTQRARFWTDIGDQQHSYDVYDFTINRSRDGPVKFLPDQIPQGGVFGRLACRRLWRIRRDLPGFRRFDHRGRLLESHPS
jgi:hypothetical protein